MSVNLDTGAYLMRTFTTMLTALFVLGNLVGCASRELARLDPAATKSQRQLLGVSGSKVDILFVIDNSGSMRDEQASLRNNFGLFMERLRNQAGNLPSLHIGVITTEGGLGYHHKCNREDTEGNYLLNHAGKLHSAPVGEGCTENNRPQGTMPFLFDVFDEQGLRVNNHHDDLERTFGCIAEVGANSCGTEQPLEAIRRTFDFELHPENANFFREDAFLAIVIITDEDDCSKILHSAQTNPFVNNTDDHRDFVCVDKAVVCDQPLARSNAMDDQITADNPVIKTNCRVRTAAELDLLTHHSEYVELLAELKGDASKILVATIAGNGNQVRVYDDNDETGAVERRIDTSEGAPAFSPIRLNAFLEGFPNQNVSTSIHTSTGAPDLSEPLIAIGEFIGNRIHGLCFDEAVDLQPETSEVEADCVVHIVDSFGSEATHIPPCETDSNESCWQFSRNASECQQPLIQLDVHNQTNGYRQAELQVECLLRTN